MKLVLIRHGWTKFNEHGILCGRQGDELSEKGMEELSSLVKEFPYPEVERVYSSPMKRCIQTSKIVFPNQDPIIVDDLREIDFGIYDGCKASDVRKETTIFSDKNNLKDPFPGGESRTELAVRVVKAMEKIVQDSRKLKCVAVVGHSMAFTMLFNKCMRTPLTLQQAFCPNGMGFFISLDPDEFLSEHKMDYIMGLPENAPRPDMSNSPYLSDK